MKFSSIVKDIICSRHSRRNCKIIITALLILFISRIGLSESVLDIKSLEGNWEGVGEFLVPGVNSMMEISGKAEFRYNNEKDYLRTALTGEKFLFTYSDSGHLAMDKNSDSLTWEVWDNFGRHVKYRGEADGLTVRGSRLYKKKKYEVEIKLVHIDTIDFRLTAIDNKGNSKDKATFHLWRIK